MSIRPAHLFCFAILVVSTSLSPHSVTANPNIVILLCDDLGYGDLGCFGHPHIRTPRLDELASQGIRLTSCYSAAPVCSPSRVGLLTGRSPNRSGVYDWIPEASSKRPGNRGMVHLRGNQWTIAKLARHAGYRTGMFGKYHGNARFNDDSQAQPDDIGFNHWVATQNNAHPSHRNPKNFVRDGAPVGEVKRFSCQFVIDETIRWIDSGPAEKPFFAYVPFHEPHEPVESPTDLVKSYLKVAESDDQAQYFANVSNVDRAVGRLIDHLKERQLLENTMIVFTSDNGPETLNRYKRANRSHGTPGPLRGMKLHTTEAGFRVPGIIAWPSRIASGQVVESAVSSLDIMPTLGAMLGVGTPPDLVLDGVDLSPAFGEEGRWQEDFKRNKPLLWVYYNSLNQASAAMRSGKYKVLARLDGGQLEKVSNLTKANAEKYLGATLTDIEIYDVTTDIDESDGIEDTSITEPLIAEMRSAYESLLKDSHVWE
ncbi:MAG: sulfatase-like hydrolase/transferase [Planctomycetota bacterium]